MTTGRRSAFTLIELMVVMSILAILGSLVWVGMRDTLQAVKVQRTVQSLLQGFDEARALAIATGRVHTAVFNNAGDVRPDLDLGDWWNRSPPADKRRLSGMHLWDPAAGRWGFSENWSADPRDQWFAITGPWRDAAGNWWQARGGMPINSTQWHGELGMFAWDLIDADGRPTSRRYAKMENGHGVLMGGIFGHALDAQGRLPADQRTESTMVRMERGVWDPYGIQVGARRLFEGGTRLMALPDNPEWGWMSFTNTGDLITQRNRSGRWYGSDTIGFQGALSPKLVAGRNGGGDGQQTTCLNFYPSGMIDRNFCDDATSFLPSGAPLNQGRAFLGVVSAKVREAEFTDPAETPATVVAYDRPVSMSYITLWTNGDITSGSQPMVMR